MATTFLISDTHFGHVGVTKFLREDGTKLRPWDTVEEMDEELIKRWNDTVRPNDKVYHLGDVVMNRKALSTMSRLNGDKVLIKGNHDIFKLEDYTPYFRDIRAYHVMDGYIMSHIPVHSESKGRFRGNIHGHTHAYNVIVDNIPDLWYHCVCVEQIDYRPISFEEVKKKIALLKGI